LSTFSPDISWELLLRFAGRLTICLFAFAQLARRKFGRQQRQASRRHHPPKPLGTPSCSVAYGACASRSSGFRAPLTADELTIATLLTGMIGAGGLVLKPATTGQRRPMSRCSSASALAALWRSGNPAYSGVAALVSVYAPLVTLAALTAWRKSMALINAESQSQQQQEQTISVLLSDFEQNAGDALWETDAAGRLVHIYAQVVRAAPSR